MHRENWSEGHLSNFRRALQLILSSALKLTIAMLQLYREECRKPDVGRVALGRGKRGQSAGAAHLSYPDPEAHPSSASAPTLYHIPSSHLISNMWRKVQQKYGGCLLTFLLRLIPLLICLSTCANTIYYVHLPVKYANQI